MENKDKILLRYKEALIDHYYDYLDVIKQLNAQIPLLTDDLRKSEGLKDLDHENIDRFTYPTFCVSFLDNLRIELEEDTTFTKSTINNIFMVMVEDKILESSELSSDE